MPSWDVSYARRKPLDDQPLVRIPNRLRLAIWGKLEGLDGQDVAVAIAAGGRVLWRGPLRVTSGGELHVIKAARDAVRGAEELTFIV